MRFVKFATGLFLCILLFYPLKTFWGDYFSIKGVVYDIVWIFFAVVFLYVYGMIFDKFIKK